MKRIVLLILGMALLAGAATAQVEPEGGFLPLYWIKGRVTSFETGSVVPNRTVVFFKNANDYYSGKLVSAETLGDGSYKLNAYDLQYWHGVDVTLGSGSYFIGVPSTETESNGTLESITLITEQGWMQKDLVLVDGGWELEKGLLWISRDGDNIKISWEVEDTPDIYYLTGSFNNSYDASTLNWVKALDGLSGAASPGFTAYIPDKYIRHENQVQMGDNEVYYKALPAGETDLATNIPLAQTVGKVDLLIENGYNLINLPFVFDDPSVDSVIGDQLEEKDQFYKIGVPPSNRTLTGWEPSLNFALMEGNWIYREGDPVPITVVGRVSEAEEKRVISENYNLVGNAYPLTIPSLSAAGFSDPVEGDQLYVFTTVAEPYDLSSLKIDPNTKAGFWDSGVEILPFKGYWYFRNTETPMDWVPPKP